MTDNNVAQGSATPNEAIPSPASPAVEANTSAVVDATNPAPTAESNAPPAEGQQSEGKAETPQGPPEKYEIVYPDGYQIDADTHASFEQTAKDLGLNNEQAQKLAEFGPRIAQLAAQQQAQLVEQIQAEWLEKAKSDKEFGGAAYEANLAITLKAQDAYGTPALKELLQQSGLERHPEVIRFFWKVGKGLSEDTIVNNGDRAASKRSTAQVLWGDRYKSNA